ncbi:MAG: Rrf2 family transcriptional regulator [Deltaproteobacteria bacterium]|nr:Rrf2 family transcriptional regulator [Deltaproteobacteria bacterium]
MPISQKAQYAVRAVFELAKRQGAGATKIGEIAEAQAIPQRFLENILNSLKGGGFVESVRGKDGGYLLARPAKELTVGAVLRFVEGPLAPVECMAGNKKGSCPMYGGCPFLSLWARAEKALEGVYDSTTFYELVAQEAEERRKPAVDFTI